LELMAARELFCWPLWVRIGSTGCKKDKPPLLHDDCNSGGLFYRGAEDRLLYRTVKTFTDDEPIRRTFQRLIGDRGG